MLQLYYSEKAHKLIMVNRRMERALQRVSENNMDPAPTLSTPSIPVTAPVTTSFKSALQGVPASLLEKVFSGGVIIILKIDIYSTVIH